MTNAEYFLKAGVSVEEFIKEITYYIQTSMGYGLGYRTIVESFLEASCKPTLTEDERVILRNIDTKTVENGFGKIKRTENGDIVLVAYGRANFNIHIFNHLFQFIKERRRI